ncbi:beta-microseminoprotein-like [Heterocephalus glaber]|uniref:Beta-microseminoprotein n=1 Tax=Heterocephalus glaber TaxID=10181 RepID=A0AAX6SHT2_HETGA|nr:beta-microseminoprotein-like [Heterocephalus glaber]
MKVLWGSLMVLATFMTSCSAFCYFIPMKVSDVSSPHVCKYLDGITYPMNSNWNTKYCENCTCNERGIKCCKIAAIPLDCDKIECHAIFYHQNCTYTVVEHQDHRKNCAVGTWML